MPLHLADRRDKSEIVTLLQRVLQALVFQGHGVTPADRELLLNHLAWMGRQSGTMNVSCALETFPPNRTRIVIDTTFGDGA